MTGGVNIWDDLIAVTDDLQERIQITRIRTAVSYAFVFATLRDYEKCEEWLDLADRVAKENKIAWCKE